MDPPSNETHCTSPQHFSEHTERVSEEGGIERRCQVTSISRGIKNGCLYRFQSARFHWLTGNHVTLTCQWNILCAYYVLMKQWNRLYKHTIIKHPSISTFFCLTRLFPGNGKEVEFLLKRRLHKTEPNFHYATITSNYGYQLKYIFHHDYFWVFLLPYILYIFYWSNEHALVSKEMAAQIYLGNYFN